MAEHEPRKPAKRTNRTPKARRTPGADATTPRPEQPTSPAQEAPAAEARERATEPASVEPASLTAGPGGPRMVLCAKLGRELPGLARRPFPGELGQRIYEHISEQAWEMWQERSTLLINHYGLNLADPDARQIMRQQMEEFFFGQDARMPEGWVQESAGAKGKGAVAPRK